MTFEEYNEQMNKASEKLKENYTEELYKSVSEFQYAHMEEFLNEYKKTVDSPAKEVCYDLLYYAVHESQSGNAIVDADFVTNEDEAAELKDTIFEEIGKYLLDDCEVYKESNGQWVADAMFGGNYVPYWDGWRD